MNEVYTPRQQRQAAGYLILATVFWGCSFTWTKEVIELINHRLGLDKSSAAGVTLLTGVRFILAAGLWFGIFPGARRGWNRRDLWRGAVLGALMGAGMLLQTAGLGLTSVAVSSFLTSLTVLFVPLIGILVHFKLPSPILTSGVLLATAGIWLLTGATPTGFGLGEVLGLSCAIVFSFQIMAINAFTTPANTHRMTTMMLLVSGLLALLAAPVFAPRLDIGFVLEPTAWPRMLLLLFICTIGAFGLQMSFQPRVNPTRAALLYLFEPIFAAAWAYLEIREKLSWTQFSGAALIIIANALVELLSAWGKKEEIQKVALP